MKLKTILTAFWIVPFLIPSIYVLYGQEMRNDFISRDRMLLIGFWMASLAIGLISGRYLVKRVRSVEPGVFRTAVICGYLLGYFVVMGIFVIGYYIYGWTSVNLRGPESLMAYSNIIEVFWGAFKQSLGWIAACFWIPMAGIWSGESIGHKMKKLEK
ncbi:hypothetical protein K1X84_04655 [bacterium]|nr:hypothetical protein [bacterium]